jgi:hypothetical protein
LRFAWPDYIRNIYLVAPLTNSSLLTVSRVVEIIELAGLSESENEKLRRPGGVVGRRSLLDAHKEDVLRLASVLIEKGQADADLILNW